MTERLYYTDAYLREFDASVSRVESSDVGTIVCLDRTAFYPASGGQPFDVGDLNGMRVIDVVDRKDEIAHVVDAPADAFVAGRSVHGSIDWTRRFDHMQQHTGQHVLSAAIDRRFGVRTVSFHMGADSSTIDLARELTHGELAAAEADANRVVWEDREVAVRFVSAEDAAALPLRKEPAREGTLRLVDVGGFDLSACGGTHVARTGGVGIIAIGAVERFKGGQRVEFFCGGRALKKFGSMRDVIAGSIRVLSVMPGELPAAIERIQAEARERQKAIAALQAELSRFRAE